MRTLFCLYSVVPSRPSASACVSRERAAETSALRGGGGSFKTKRVLTPTRVCATSFELGDELGPPLRLLNG